MGVIPVRTKKGMMQPGKEYCEHFDIKHKVISRRAKGSFSYPLWCPIGNFSTCDQCGTKIRIEEGCYCKRCR
jgi:hypothetical protein